MSPPVKPPSPLHPLSPLLVVTERPELCSFPSAACFTCSDTGPQCVPPLCPAAPTSLSLSVLFCARSCQYHPSGFPYTYVCIIDMSLSF